MKNIIVVDMQKGLMNENNKYLIDKINNFLQNNTFDNIYYTQFYNEKDSQYVKFLNWDKMSTKAEQELSVKDIGGIKLNKMSYGLTQNQINTIKEQNINEIYLCGTDIDACVLAIGFQLFDNGIKPIFIKKLCASASKEQNIFDRIEPIIARNFGRDSII